MTELTAPPVSVGAHHAYWRQKDTSAPLLVELTVDTLGEAAGSNYTPPVHNHTYGTGKNGKRLWMYSPGFSWIPVPVGRGEDTSLASLNIYDSDTHKWQTPTWIEHDPVISKHGFSARAGDGQTYTNLSHLNTNYTAFNLPYTPTTPGYLRLFYTQPRPDPTWRVIDLLKSIPKHTPSAKINTTDYTLFDQWGARRAYYRNDTFDGRVFIDDDPTTQAVAFANTTAINDGLGYTLARQSYGKFVNNGSATAFKSGLQQLVALLDLRAVKNHLSEQFPYTDIDYVGQYDHIVLSHVEKVTIVGKVAFEIYYGPSDNSFTYGQPDLTQYMKTIRFRLYYDTNAPGVPMSSFLYGPRYPADTVTSGTVFMEQVGLPGVSVYTANPQFGSEAVSGSYSIKFNRFFTLNLIFPGEDNIRFSVAVDNIPEPGFTTAQHDPSGHNNPVPGGYPGTISATATLSPQSIKVYYVEPNVSTPASVAVEDFNLGSFIVT